MAECTYHDLRKARESRFPARWQFAQEFNYSEDVVERIETGKQIPTPDQVDRWEELTEVTGLWHSWMCSNCDSYRKRYKDVQVNGLLESVVRVKYELQDVLRMQDEVEQDALTGSIDCPSTLKRYRKELQDAAAIISKTLAQLPDDKK